MICEQDSEKGSGATAVCNLIKVIFNIINFFSTRYKLEIEIYPWFNLKGYLVDFCSHLNQRIGLLNK